MLKVENVLVIDKLTQSIERLDNMNLYTEDLQTLLDSYIVQLQKEFNDYREHYEVNSMG